ncbi:MAG: tRNA pseudouridine(55) synthase TruB [Patescibacteria group bacterium]
MTTKNSKKVLIFGSFDLLHPGHISLLRFAKQHGDVTAIIARDKTIQKHKHQSPFYDEQTRVKNIENLKLATPVLGDTKDHYAVLDTYTPDIIILGYDQKLFTDKLEAALQEKNIQSEIIRAPEFHPEHFKSSRLRRALSDPEAGFVYINKPKGITSHDVIYKLRKKLDTKKIGHAGTLDPLATGVLICGVNKATTLLDWWHTFPKTYKAELEFGKVSDTYDSDGIVQESTNKTKPTIDEIQKKLHEMTGNIEQTPPAHSAKKVKGKKAYELARKGKDFELKSQTVTIHKISLTLYEYPKATITVTCSTGTYIRSLIHDLGQSLGCGAIMTGLTRSVIGPVTIDMCQSLDATLHKTDVHSFQNIINQHFSKKELL